MRSLVLLALLCSACGSSSPTAPTSTAPPIPTPPSAFTIAGTLTATNGLQALAGATITTGTITSVTDGAGRYTLAEPGTSSSTGLILAIAGAGLVTRRGYIAPNGHTANLDAIALGGGFDLNFYREMVRDGFEAPGALEVLRRWTRTPQIYLKTVDEGGGAIDAQTLDQIDATARAVVPLWTSGALGVPVITRGTDTRVGVSGWITIRFPLTNTIADGFCGRAQVGTDGGYIELGYHDPPTGGQTCRVAGAVIAIRTIRHEFGHALGFWHTDNANDLMYGGTWTNANQQPNARELYHAAIAYARPVGNLDPDNDPVSAVLSLPPRVVR